MVESKLKLFAVHGNEHGLRVETLLNYENLNGNVGANNGCSPRTAYNAERSEYNLK